MRRTPKKRVGRHKISRARSMAFGVVSQVTDFLFLSGVRPLTLSNVRNFGITTIVNCTIDLPDLPIGADDIEFVRVRVDDSPFFDMSVYFDPVADRIQEVYLRGGKVLIHCMAGASRSPTLCLAYLMKYHRMRLRDAFRYLKQRRPVVHPNYGFFKQLIDYENQLFGSTSVEMVQVPTLGPAFGLVPDIYLEECKGMLWLQSLKAMGQ